MISRHWESKWREKGSAPAHFDGSDQDAARARSPSPYRAGRAPSTCVKASNPPAEAPSPTIGKLFALVRMVCADFMSAATDAFAGVPCFAVAVGTFDRNFHLHANGGFYSVLWESFGRFYSSFKVRLRRECSTSASTDQRWVSARLERVRRTSPLRASSDKRFNGIRPALAVILRWK